jgi:hypothetical protein
MRAGLDLSKVERVLLFEPLFSVLRVKRQNLLLPGLMLVGRLYMLLFLCANNLLKDNQQLLHSLLVFPLASSANSTGLLLMATGSWAVLLGLLQLSSRWAFINSLANFYIQLWKHLLERFLFGLLLWLASESVA